jgi:hypothetical protein
MADLMHSLEEGLFKLVLECILGLLPDSAKHKIDLLVSQWFTEKGSNRSGERLNFPRVSFTRGFCTPTLLSADERVGQLFVLALLLYSKEGRAVMETRFDSKFDINRAKSSRTKESQEPLVVDAGGEDDSEESEEEDIGGGTQGTIENLSTSRNPSHLTNAEQNDLLSAIDMDYLKSHCLRRLPEHHQNVLKLLLQKHLTKTAMKIISNGLKLPSCMAFQPTTSTFRAHPQPASTIFEEVLADQELKVLMDRVVQKFPKEREGYSLRSCPSGTSQLLQQLLSFHAFCKYGGSLLTSSEDVTNYQKSYCTMMTALKQAIGRGDNTRGFKLQKFVECSHFLKEHLVFGPTVGHNSDTGERGLKMWAKKAAKTAQKRTDDVFKGQVTKNLQQTEILEMLESSCMATMKRKHDRIFIGFNEESEEPETPEQGEHVVSEERASLATYGKNFVFQLRFKDGAGPFEEDGSHKEVECAIYSGSRKEQDVTGIFPVAVVDWLDRKFRPLWLEQQSSQPLRIQLVTEIKLLDPETQTFSHIVRAHPNYRNEGCWYDYVEIDYGSDGKFPARCAAFFQWPPILKHPEGDVDFQFLEDTGDDLIGLFHQCQYQHSSEKDLNSLLFSQWRLQHTTSLSSTLRSRFAHEPKVVAKFVCLHPGAINRRIFAIDPTPTDGGPFHRLKALAFHFIKVEDRLLEWPGRYLHSHQNWSTASWEKGKRKRGLEARCINS